MGPEESIRLAINGRTDIGLVRSENEDNIRWRAHKSLPFGYIVIADGMGGYTGGAKASEIAAACIGRALDEMIGSTFLSCTPDQQSLMIHAGILEAINLANEEILVAKITNPQFSNMGSTVVLALVWKHQLTVAHLGDSRAYLWSQSGLRQLTCDHSVVQEMIESGSLTEQQARTSGVRNHITRALGVEREIDPTISSFTLSENSLLMLCTDGLTEYLDSGELELVLSTHRPALECCYRFIADANARGGKDNISVGIIEYTVHAGEESNVNFSTQSSMLDEDVTVRKQGRE